MTPDLRDTLLELMHKGLITEDQARTILERAPAPSSPVSSGAPTVGGDTPARFGKYVLIEKLGEGGMGEVWRAWQADLGRWVALKFVKGGDVDAVARFIREAQTAAKLSHPNIVTTFEAGELEGKHFIAMDYIEGNDLSTLRLPARRAAELIRDAAEAVHFAHQRGIIHRDLKPANLMLSKEGRLIVMDFGLARSMTVPSGLSVSGMIVGTPQYMAPEQALGEKLDGRADVYSLGAALYELVTGVPPFEADAVAELLRRVIDDEPTPPRRLAPKLGRDIETIVLKCLEKDPEKRYPTAKDLAEDLSRELAGEPISARPASWGYRWWKRARKQPVLYAMGALLAAAVVAGSAILVAGDVKARGLQAQREDALRQKGREERRQRIIQAATVAVMEADAELADPVIELTAIRKKLNDVVRSLQAGLEEFADDEWMRVWLGRANDLLFSGDAALKWYDLAIRDHPTNARAHLYRAQTRLNAYLRTFAQFGNPDIESEQRRLLILINDDLGEAARGVLTQSEADVLECYRMLGEAKDRKRLVERCEARIRLKGRTETYHLLLAMVAQIESRRDDAIRHFDDALDRHPRLVTAFLNRGGMKWSQGNLQGALEDFSKALELNPDDAEAVLNRGVAKGSLGDNKGMLEDSERAIALKPADGMGYFTRGAAKARLGDRVGAIRDLTRALDLKPGFAMALFDRGMVRAEIDDAAGALEDLTKAIDRAPRYAEAYSGRSAAKRMLRDYSGAIEDATKAIDLNPGLALAYFNRGAAKLNAGDLAGSIEDSTKSIELGFALPESYENRGAAKFNLEDYPGAAADYAKALEVAPANWSSRDDVKRFLADAQRQAAGSADY